MTGNLGVWVGAVATLAVYSTLYKRNPLSRAVELLFVGMAAGYGLVMAYTTVVNKAIKPLSSGQVLLVVPLALGLLLFTRFSKSIGYLGRMPMAFIVSAGAALAMRGAVEAELIKQVSATIIPLNSINNVIMVCGTIGTIAYFLYTVRSKQIGPVSQIGKWTMMVAFGAAFGNAVQGRISLFIGRLQYLLGDWLGLIK